MLVAPQPALFTESVKKKRRIQLDDSNLVNPEEESKNKGGVDLSTAAVSLGKPKSVEEDPQTLKALRWYVSLEECKSFVSMKNLLENDGIDLRKMKKKKKSDKNDEEVEVSDEEDSGDEGSENEDEESDNSQGSYYDVDDPFIDDSGIVMLFFRICSVIIILLLD